MIHVVLFEPLIAGNTGAIMRTCLAANADLSLIEPLGFRLDTPVLRRSGVSAADECVHECFPDINAYFARHPNDCYAFFTRYGHKTLSDFPCQDVTRDYSLVFGKETTGLPLDLLRSHEESCYRIPISEKVRALNLASSVAIGLFHVLACQDWPGLAREEPACFKGADWL